MEQKPPLVSAVICTRERSHLIGRAVQFVLAQTLGDLEVIVVVDGPDASTVQALQHISDPRLRIIHLSEWVGRGEARNVGVNASRGEWVAFLDDDDEWMPQKLEIQLQTAERSPHAYPIVSCRVIVRSQTGQVVLPRRVYQYGEPLSEYLFCRKGLHWGDGILPTITWFAKKEILQRVPFRKMQRLEDLDWLLRANLQQGVSIEFVSTREPLAVWNMRKYGRKTTRDQRRPGADGLHWMEENRQLFTPRAYAACILLSRSVHIAPTRDPRVFLYWLRKAFRHGRPRMLDVAIYAGIWLGLDRFRVQRRVSGWGPMEKRVNSMAVRKNN